MLNRDFHARHVMSKADERRRPSILSSLKADVDMSAYTGMGDERRNELIDEAIDIPFTVILVFTWHELMSVPNEIDVKRRHKERDWGRTHEIEEAIYKR